MKIHSIAIAMISGAAVLLSSCVVDPGTYYGASVSYSSPGFSTSVAWTNASYDANGYPIYGYSYGRPVYGYTAAGVAIFTIGALTALCYVPDWAPAPWYHGPLHYPPHIHRVPAPPKYAHGHAPHHRPSGGMHAPIHKNPSSILGKPNHTVNHKPQAHVNHKPNAPRPNHNAKAPANNHKPNVGVNHKPNVGNAHKPSQVKPNNTANHRPAQNRVNNTVKQKVNTTHVQPQRTQSARPAVSQGAGKVRQQVSRPAASVSKPAAAAKVSKPALNRASGAARTGARAAGRAGVRH